VNRYNYYSCTDVVMPSLSSYVMGNESSFNLSYYAIMFWESCVIICSNWSTNWPIDRKLKSVVFFGCRCISVHCKYLIE